MTNLLLFYNICQLFEDDLRLIAYFIDEENAKKTYKHLLKGHFERYVVELQEKLDKFDGNLEEWKKDCMLKIDFSRDEMMLHSDFENIGE